MPAPYTGRCFGGSAQYRVAEEPLVVYACHCTDCQKRSGFAFPEGVPRYETQPDFKELFEIGKRP